MDRILRSGFLFPDGSRAPSKQSRVRRPFPVHVPIRISWCGMETMVSIVAPHARLHLALPIPWNFRTACQRARHSRRRGGANNRFAQKQQGQFLCETQPRAGINPNEKTPPANGRGRSSSAPSIRTSRGAPVRSEKPRWRSRALRCRPAPESAPGSGRPSQQRSRHLGFSTRWR